MVCKELCKRYKKKRGYSTPDSRWCMLCDMWMAWDGNYCPCCNSPIRSSSRNYKSKKNKKSYHHYE